ncbi:MAG: SgcJ/EcaC family oxidoreductase [Alphaproteobacteria bacterium]|nr:SgcJ/EcaC family oxidoreductase [Alphaproteobacteria bacterium]
MTTPTEDERALRALIAATEAAWNASDSVGFAATMTEDVDFVSMLGERYHGQEIVERGHRHILDTIYKASRVRYTIEVLRFLKPDVALVMMLQHMRSHLPPEVVASTARQRQMSPDMHDSEARATLVCVKRNGAWKIAAIHNTNVAGVAAVRK